MCLTLEGYSTASTLTYLNLRLHHTLYMKEKGAELPATEIRFLLVMDPWSWGNYWNHFMVKQERMSWSDVCNKHSKECKLHVGLPCWEKSSTNSPLLDQGEVAKDKYNTGATRYRAEGEDPVHYNNNKCQTLLSHKHLSLDLLDFYS